MHYSINPEVFVRYPGYMRAVVIAENISNTDEQLELFAELKACEQHVRETLTDDFKEHPRLAVWADTFRSLGINPNKYPPSVVNLVKRVLGGKDLPYINTLVAIFNCTSLRHLCPCGGDDLAVVQGDLLLTFAQGDETYIPLGKPDVVEHPRSEEIIYMDTATKDVFCRAWCWKNGDRSKLAPSTASAAINIDIMPPLGMKDAEHIAEEVSGMLQKYAGANTNTRFLTQQSAEFVVSVDE